METFEGEIEKIAQHVGLSPTQRNALRGYMNAHPEGGDAPRGKQPLTGDAKAEAEGELAAVEARLFHGDRLTAQEKKILQDHRMVLYGDIYGDGLTAEAQRQADFMPELFRKEEERQSREAAKQREFDERFGDGEA